jgi:hypothetical protein
MQLPASLVDGLLYQQHLKSHFGQRFQGAVFFGADQLGMVRFRL